MIDRIRAQQQTQQARQIIALRGSQTATYEDRDDISGDRILRSADGGLVRANWLSENEPQDLFYIKENSFATPNHAVAR
jgi:hypothetical protein